MLVCSILEEVCIDSKVMHVDGLYTSDTNVDDIDGLDNKSDTADRGDDMESIAAAEPSDTVDTGDTKGEEIELEHTSDNEGITAAGIDVAMVLGVAVDTGIFLLLHG